MLCCVSRKAAEGSVLKKPSLISSSSSSLSSTSTVTPFKAPANKSESDPKYDDTVELLPCTICGRTFKPQSLEKHAKICERAAIKKRKPFDSFKQRLQGTELEEFLPKVITKGRDVRPEEKCGSRNTWKQTHDEFLRTIRAARGETVVTTSSQYRQVTTITPGAPTRSNEKGLCPTCSRQFGIKAYDRHVAWCKERILRVPTTQATNVAKERLDARMKYRAPLLKNRRMTNREKYAPRIKNNVTVNNNNINNNNNNNNINAVNSGLKIKDTSGPKSADPVNIKQPAVTERRSGQGKIDGVIAPGPVKSRPADRSIKHNPDLLILTPPDYPRSHNFQDSPTSIQKFKSSFPSLTSTEADDDFNKRKLKKKLKKKKSKCIVSGLSIGNPKVNDVTVNDDVTGMTVRPCHAHREELITWKQITCDSVQIKVYDSGLNDSSLINLPQQLDQTYLIKESAGDIDNDVTEGIDAILQRLDNDLKEDEDKLNKFESTPASPSKFNIDVTCASTPVSFKNDNYARENKMINEDGCERSARPKSESINRCSTYVIGETCDTNCLKIDTQNHNKFNNTDDNIILKDPLFDTNLPDVNDKKIIIDEIIPLNVRCKSNDTDYSLTPSRYFTSDSLDSARSNRIMRKKLRKKMNVLRDSTDSLISSVEAGNVRTTEPRLDARDKINGLDELKYSKNPKKSLMFPEIVNKPDGRLEKSFNDKEIPYWKRMMRTSRSRLFCHLMKNRNNFLPPVPFAQRSCGQDFHPAWTNYVRRHPDFNLVLTSRTGICPDYDPYLLAEQQLNDLLSDTCSDKSFTDSPSNRYNIKPTSSPSTSSSPLYPLTHSSAFVKYPNSLNLDNSATPEKRGSVLAPPSEFDDLSIGFSSSDSAETNSLSRELFAELESACRREDQVNKKNHSAVLGRRVIIDKARALGTTDESLDGNSNKRVNLSEKSRKVVEKTTVKPLKPMVTRSNSVRAASAPKIPERKETAKANSRSSPGTRFNNHSRNNNCSNLSGSNLSLSSIVSSEIDVKRSNSMFDDLVSSFDDDSGSYPSLRSFLKNDPLSMSSPVQASRDRTRNGQISDEDLSSPDCFKKQECNKLSADSAYSSLNRKYSNGRNETTGRLDEDTTLARRRENGGEILSNLKSKMSKFCHECGTKFPETAKFCCECGIQRLAL